MTQQRRNRPDHVRQQLLRHGNESQRALAQLDRGERITAFGFVGVGHLTTPDAVLAAQAAARAREDRELARDALYEPTTARETRNAELRRTSRWRRRRQ
jgi:hypothetical protein